MHRFPRLKLISYILAILIVLVIAWTLRWHAVTTLSVDYDEDDYLRAAQQYRALILSDNWKGFLDTNYRPEHPPLAKIVLGVSILSAPETPLTPDRPTTASPDQSLPKIQLRDARTANAVLGMLTVALMTLVNPLAGLFLGIHAFTVKYVSQVMLEAFPAFTSLLMVVCYIRWKKEQSKKVNGWLITSAIFLGLTAASKYVYCAIGLAILADWFLDARENGELSRFVRQTLLWSLLAVVFFFIADPYLWPDPLGRLKESLLYHAAYSTGASEVQNAGFPFWQPFVWLNTSPKALRWQPEAFPVALDPFIALFAILGLSRLWKKERVYVLWLGIAILFLLAWPTKWPQYLLVLTAPLSLAAANGLVFVLIEPVRDWLARLRNKTATRSMARPAELRQALPWLIPGLFAFFIFTLLPLLFQLGISLTDFNSISIRDGLQGGIWREVWGGLTGQIKAILPQIPFRSTQVHFTGPSIYIPLLGFITNEGILVLNILWTVLSVTFQTILGVGAALLLWQRGLRFRRGWEILFILPWAIPEMIGAVMWMNVFAPTTGWLSLAAQTYGNNIPFSFLLGWENNPNMALVVLLISATWYGFPFMMLAATAGLKMVPKDVYDAVAIDGANALQTFRNVTWPLLMPLVVPAIIVRGIFAFNQFYLFQAFGVYNGTLATLSYNWFNPSGFFGFNGQFAISAVLNIITVLFLIGFVIIFNRWSKAGEGVTYA